LDDSLLFIVFLVVWTVVNVWSQRRLHRNILILLDEHEHLENEELWVASVDRFKRREQLSRAARRKK
jgi:hypothetical protein